MTVAAAHASHIPVTVCGEMAGDPRYAVLLLGLSLDELSVVPSSLPLIRRTIREQSSMVDFLIFSMGVHS